MKRRPLVVGVLVVVVGAVSAMSAVAASPQDSSKPIAASTSPGELPGAGAPPGGFSSWEELMRVQAALDAQADKVSGLETAGLGGIVVSAETRQLRVAWKGTVPVGLRRLGSAMPAGTTLSVRPAAYSRTELLAAVKRVAAQPEVATAAPAADGSGVDASLHPGRSRPTMQARAKGTAGEVPVRYAATPTELAPASRAFPTPPYWGGATWQTSSSACSTAFAVVVDGRRKMLSAGHCGSNGEVAKTRSGVVMGTVEGDDDSHDRLLIDTPAGSGGRIYDGGVAELGGTEFTKPVAYAAHSYVGDWVCTSGAFSGVLCNIKVTATDQDGEYPGGQRVSQLVQAVQVDHGAAAGEGDSGGPVFSLDPATGGVIAKGTLAAGDGKNHASCAGYPDRTCSWRVWYVDVGNTLIAYHAALVVGVDPRPNPKPNPNPNPPGDRRPCPKCAVP